MLIYACTYVYLCAHTLINHRSKEFSSDQRHLPEHEKWANEYIEEQLSQKATGDVQHVAKDMIEELTDPDIAATEFMQFVKKLSTGEAAVEGNQVRVYIHSYRCIHVKHGYCTVCTFACILLGGREIL